jgi:prevent-host-death family protein
MSIDVHMGGEMVIGIREARETLPTLIKRAAYAGEEIRVGARGVDEVVLISTRRYTQMRQTLEQLKEELADLRAQVAAMSRGEAELAQPFAGLQRALEAGELRVSGTTEVRARRVIPGFSAESAVLREERIRIGSRGAVEPKHRRGAPRA